MKLKRALLAASLATLGIVGLHGAAHARTCTEPVGDVETGCVEDSACLLASKLGWACVE